MYPEIEIITIDNMNEELSAINLMSDGANIDKSGCIQYDDYSTGDFCSPKFY